MAKKIIEIPDDMTSKLAGSTTTPSYTTTFSTPSEPEQKKAVGRPKKESSVGRIKYTTSLTKESIRFLRVESAMRDISPADLLEIIISEFNRNKD
jgi:hypothetical protein